MLLAQLPFAVFLGPALNIFTTFGEEWGWRGYLVPKTAARLRIVPTLLVTGVIWGLWHAPLTIIGHNYGVGIPAGRSPASLPCACSARRLESSSPTSLCARAAAWRRLSATARSTRFVSAGIMFSLTGGNPFVGPMPVGIVGGSAFIVVAALHAVGYAPPRESRHPRYAASGPARRHDESRPRPHAQLAYAAYRLITGQTTALTAGSAAHR